MFEVQGGFKWPLFPLTSAVLCDVDLMLPGEEHVRFKKYNSSIHTWSKVPVGHIVTLKPGEHIFLKGYDVTRCRDFDHLLSASQQRDVHFFKNLPHERTQVREGLKRKKVSRASNTVSSGDDEEEKKDRSWHRSKTTTRPPILPSRYKTASNSVLHLTPSDSDAGSRAQPLHPSVKLESTLIDLTMSDASDAEKSNVPMPAPIRNKRARSSRSPSLPSTPSLSLDGDESSDDSLHPAWPADFYVVDIVQGFKKCDEARRGRRSVAEAFIKCFKIPFRRTTFYNHRQHWDNAPAAIRDKALHAGRNSAGLWTTFLDHAHAKTVEPVDQRKQKKKRV